MPGRLFWIHSSDELAAAADAPPATQTRRNIKPGQDVLTLTDAGWDNMRWGIIPVGRTNARGRPVMETIINARSETVFEKSAFEGTARAVVPASGWYEWTGERRRKTAWELRLRSGEPLWFAAIWDRWMAPGGREVMQVATVTCPPNKDVEPIHHRMGVILDPADIGAWISGQTEEASALMKPLAEGLLQVREASDVDWSGA